jgi:hypothetical protein
MVKYVKMKRCYKGVHKHFYILKRKRFCKMPHKEKHLKTLVRKMLKIDIHHPERVNTVNQQINHVARKEIRLLPEDSKLTHQKLIELTDEIAILAESAIKSNPLARMRVSMQFTKKQEELESLYQQMFKK